MPPIQIILFCYRTGEKVEVELIFRSKMRTSEDRHTSYFSNHVATGTIVPFSIAENMARSHRRK
ncbi:hypothetical protein PVAP13_2KG394405 [Panicum virgatum]|uniref:Uncharacterized protein n=1 Tax=Panicum virgatum TaxID=38727 RepID=A0A8T0WK56_PANVG|nr:hypothetical protein PVAP13_2KG394405 [Panicum virgatum]